MSEFKRMQSKVFWGHMATQDFNNTSLLHSNKCYNKSKIYLNSYCNFAHNSDTNNDQSNENKLINIYDHDLSLNNKIHCDEIKCGVWKNTHENDKECYKDLSILVKQQNYIQMVSRPFSPLDQGNGSLDSGFSDSEHLRGNQSAENIDNSTKRRRKHRRSREKRDNISMNTYQSETFLLQVKNDLSLNPTYTSTPKQNIRKLQGKCNIQHDDKFLRILNEDVFNNQRIEEEEVEASIDFSTTSIHPSHNEECLHDFLYTNEPPEDDELPTTSSSSTSRGSTPLFVEPWYSRISTESSLNSTSKLIDKKEKIIFDEKIYSSVKMWLKDLIQDVEYECSVTFQSKALPKHKRLCKMSAEKETKDLKMMTAKATAAATELLVRADSFTKNIQNLISKISYLENKRSKRELLRHLEKEAFTILSELGAPPSRRIHDGSLRCILNQVEALNKIVICTLDTRLDFYIEKVVRGLEDALKESGSVARGALAALTALGLAGPRAGNSIARCSGIRALLTSLVSASRLSSGLRASTLRALASVCCCPLAINFFVKEGGPEILTNLLISKNTPETERMEGTALVVQITAPWINALGLIHLEPFGNVLINGLTHLAEETICGQTLLLCAAALNNLSDSKTCTQAIVQYDSVHRLLRCVKKSQGTNIWLMEQVVSLINKLAKSYEGRKHLAKVKASVALISFLRMAPPGLEDAYQRLFITAATALTRLCVDEEIAKQVVAVGGVDCLPNRQLHDNDNNNEQLGMLQYSKSLRIACKRAAKRINDAKACGHTI